jgi:transposase-like protein
MMDLARPRSGHEYPRDFNQLLDWFPNDERCVEYLEALRWPKAFTCPYCKSTAGWRTSRGDWSCGGCQRRISVTAKTTFAGTRTPLRTWFHAAWYMTNQKYGVSALGLKRVLGMSSAQTAWTMLHKYRMAMVRPGRDQIKGVVEVDETFVGGVDRHGGRGRGAAKAIVAIAVEIREGEGFGRARMQHVQDASHRSLIPFVLDEVEAGSAVRTDAWGGYSPLSGAGYEHRIVSLSTSGDPAHVEMPGVHRLAALLKRWLLETHHGAVEGKHLQAYLNEYVFRFNRRRARSRPLLWLRLLQQAVAVGPTTYTDIVGDDELG